MNSSFNTVEYLSTLLQQQKQAVIALKQIWSNVMPDAPVPGDNSFYLWLQLHDIKVIIKGITQTAKKWGSSVKPEECEQEPYRGCTRIYANQKNYLNCRSFSLYNLPVQLPVASKNGKVKKKIQKS